jgi:nanoRNase/pAp phosphatase (c-di-AMP/oligoRNAs hydrolase)
MVTEMLMRAGVQVTDAEATLLAIGIHADTGDRALPPFVVLCM